MSVSNDPRNCDGIRGLHEKGVIADSRDKGDMAMVVIKMLCIVDCLRHADQYREAAYVSWLYCEATNPSKGVKPPACLAYPMFHMGHKTSRLLSSWNYNCVAGAVDPVIFQDLPDAAAVITKISSLVSRVTQYTKIAEEYSNEVKVTLKAHDCPAPEVLGLFIGTITPAFAGDPCQTCMDFSSLDSIIGSKNPFMVAAEEWHTATTFINDWKKGGVMKVTASFVENSGKVLSSMKVMRDMLGACDGKYVKVPMCDPVETIKKNHHKAVVIASSKGSSSEKRAKAMSCVNWHNQTGFANDGSDDVKPAGVAKDDGVSPVRDIKVDATKVSPPESSFKSPPSMKHAGTGTPTDPFGVFHGVEDGNVSDVNSSSEYDACMNKYVAWLSSTPGDTILGESKISLLESHGIKLAEKLLDKKKAKKRKSVSGVAKAPPKDGSGSD